MHRRRFLQLFGGLTVAALPGWRQGLGRDRVVVAGAGILGASIAWHLAQRGARVTVLEKSEPAAGATGKSFAWLNATFVKQPRHYHVLHRYSLAGWRHLELRWDGALGVQWGGSLEWYGEAELARQLRRNVRSHQSWGYATRLVDADQFDSLEPEIEPGPVLAAAFSENEGSVDPVHAARTFVGKAEAAGAEFVYPCEVTGLDLSFGRLRGVRSTRGDFPCDVLVVACGTGTPRLAAMAGVEVPLVDSPGLLAHTTPEMRHIHRVVLAPGAHMKQKVDGSVVTGVGFGGTPSTDTSPEQGQRMLEASMSFLPPLADAELDRVTLGWRPLPRDGHPVVGFPQGSPQVYLAVMHSGMSLAPIVGRLAAIEILDRVDAELLRPYRVERFAASSAGAVHPA